MVEFNDRRPQPYFPHRGDPAKRAQPTQGKLFADPKPTDEHRYQRGYTPERMRGVKETEDQGRLQIMAESGRPATEQRIREHIARSATPGNQMSGLTVQIHNKAHKNFGGLYSDNGRGYGTIHLFPHHSGDTLPEKREYGGRFLLHEMGHHRSMLEGTEHSAYDTAGKIGREEAFADDNSMERFRPDPRDVRRGKNVQDVRLPYENRGTFGLSEKAMTSQRQYRKTRSTPIQRDIRERRQQATKRDRAINPGLFHRNGEPTDAANPNISAEQFADLPQRAWRTTR